MRRQAGGGHGRRPRDWRSCRGRELGRGVSRGRLSRRLQPLGARAATVQDSPCALPLPPRIGLRRAPRSSPLLRVGCRWGGRSPYRPRPSVSVSSRPAGRPPGGVPSCAPHSAPPALAESSPPSPGAPRSAVPPSELLLTLPRWRGRTVMPPPPLPRPGSPGPGSRSIRTA